MRVVFTLFYVLLIAVRANAGGGVLNDNHELLRWASSPVRYSIDRGSLGGITNTDAARLVYDSFGTWSDNDLASLRFVRGSDLPRDFTGASLTSRNLTEILRGELDGMNPIFFDSDGSIVENFYGSGSKQDILGFSSQVYSGAEIVQAYAVLNGVFVTEQPFGLGYTKEEYQSTVVHELGHFCGLDHTMVGRHMALDGYGPNDKFVAVMYPTTTDDETERMNTVWDDEIAYASLYPNSNGLLTSNYGAIEGVAERLPTGQSSLSALKGGNVVARKVDDPLEIVVSCVSDYLKNGDGAYRLPGLPKGEYEVWIEPVSTFFYGSSAVGPYAAVPSDRSFTEPPMPEYYNGVDEGEDPVLDPRSRSERVTVKKTKTKTVDIIARILDESGVGENERDSQILSYGNGLDAAAAARGSDGSVIVRRTGFCVVVSPEDQMLRIEVDAKNDVDLGMFVAFNRTVRVNNFDWSVRTASADEVFELRRDGNPGLNDGTYFIEVISESTQAEEFTITAYTEADLPPTATPTPTSTSTPTQTSTPAPTPSNTPTATVTNTPTIPVRIESWNIY